MNIEKIVNMVSKGAPQSLPKKRNSNLYIIIMLFIAGVCFVLGGILGYLVGFSMGEENGISANISPTPKVEVTKALDEGNVGVEPTIEEDPYEGWLKYVLADCKVNLLAPPEWLSGRRGEDGSCGSFKSKEDTLANNLDEYEGVLMVVIDLDLVDSKYAYGNVKDIETLIKRFKTDPEGLNPDEALLIEQREVRFAGTDAIYAQISRPGIGMSYNIFYEIDGKNYALIWGGTEVEIEQETIDLITARAKKN